MTIPEKSNSKCEGDTYIVFSQSAKELVFHLNRKKTKNTSNFVTLKWPNKVAAPNRCDLQLTLQGQILNTKSMNKYTHFEKIISFVHFCCVRGAWF